VPSRFRRLSHCGSNECEREFRREARRFDGLRVTRRLAQINFKPLCTVAHCGSLQCRRGGATRQIELDAHVNLTQVCHERAAAFRAKPDSCCFFNSRACGFRAGIVSGKLLISQFIRSSKRTTRTDGRLVGLRLRFRFKLYDINHLPRKQSPHGGAWGMLREWRPRRI